MNKKQKIAELLYDLPTNKVSTEIVRWVMSHLPDDDTRGTNSIKSSPVNHEESDLHVALGMTNEGVITLGQKLQVSFPADSNNSKKSVVIEKFYVQLTDPEKMFLIGHGIPPFQEFSGSFILDKFGIEGLEKVTGESLPPDLRKHIETIGSIQKHMEMIKSLLSKGGQNGE